MKDATLGHQAGDALLVEIASRLNSCVRSVDTVARLGGDEFAVLLEEFRTNKEVISVASRIQSEVRRAFLWNGKEIVSGASVGIVLQTRDCAGDEDNPAGRGYRHVQGQGARTRTSRLPQPHAPGGAGGHQYGERAAQGYRRK